MVDRSELRSSRCAWEARTRARLTGTSRPPVRPRVTGELALGLRNLAPPLPRATHKRLVRLESRSPARRSCLECASGARSALLLRRRGLAALASGGFVLCRRAALTAVAARTRLLAAVLRRLRRVGDLGRA